MADCRFGGANPQADMAFSLEEAPTFGRGSSRGRGYNRFVYFVKSKVGNPLVKKANLHRFFDSFSIDSLV